MKSKKTAAILCVTLMATLFITACGESDSGIYDYGDEGNTATQNREIAEADYDADYEGAAHNATLLSTSTTQNLTDKIIYTHYADIETRDFGDTISQIDALIATHGAFIENSSISSRTSGKSSGYMEYRYAYYTIRIPSEQLGAVKGKLDTLGNVLNQNSNAENITAQFMDTQARINSLLVQEERLLDMISQAKDVPELITIESHLSDVRYQIESYQSTLTNWQRSVDYSTLTLSITEVVEYTEITDNDRTYWQKIGDGFMKTLRGVGSFFADLFMWIIISVPVLIILAVLTAATIFIIRVCTRKSKVKKEANRKAAAEAYAAYYNQAQAPLVTENPQTSPETNEQTTNGAKE